MTNQTVFIVDDDEAIRDAMSMLLDASGFVYRSFASADEFLTFVTPDHHGCVVLDIRMPGLNGLQCQRELKARRLVLPIIFITGHGDIPMAVQAMRDGALDFIRKPFRDHDLLDQIQQALSIEAGHSARHVDREKMLSQVDLLSVRERKTFERIAEGLANKVVAFELGVSERTIEICRAKVMKKLGVRTLAQLVRIKIMLEKSA